jgi:hypothetical protein
MHDRIQEAGHAQIMCNLGSPSAGDRVEIWAWGGVAPMKLPVLQ